jgi:hypothetical protein
MRLREERRGAVQRLQVASWLFPTLLCLCLSTVFFLEWRTSRADQRQAAGAFSETVKTINNKLAFESTQTRSLLKTFGEGLERLSKRLEEMAVRRGETPPPVEPAYRPEEGPRVALEH